MCCGLGNSTVANTFIEGNARSRRTCIPFRYTRMFKYARNSIRPVFTGTYRHLSEFHPKILIGTGATQRISRPASTNWPWRPYRNSTAPLDRGRWYVVVSLFKSNRKLVKASSPSVESDHSVAGPVPSLQFSEEEHGGSQPKRRKLSPLKQVSRRLPDV